MGASGGVSRVVFVGIETQKTKAHNSGLACMHGSTQITGKSWGLMRKGESQKNNHSAVMLDLPARGLLVKTVVAEKVLLFWPVFPNKPIRGSP